MRLRKGRWMLFAILLMLSGAGSLAAESTRNAPNILFILVDDLGWRDLSCYGSKLYKTPHIDRVAKTGTRFTQAYVAYPRCIPSRYAILTGKHPAAIQRNSGTVRLQTQRDVTFGQAFQKAGYATFYCGKWHLGEGKSSPDKLGFSTTVAAGNAGATRSHFAPYTESRSKGGDQGTDLIAGLDDAPRNEYLTDRLTEETARFIRSNRDKPFVAVVAHYAVHTPLEGKQEIVRQYARKIARKNYPAHPFEKEGAGDNLLVQNNAAYAAMIESVDVGVGRLLRLLEDLKIDDRTVVVITSDNGGQSARGGSHEVATSNRPLRAGKGHLYDGGLRVPLLIRWPRHTKAGTVIKTPVVSMDLFPTFLDMAELPLQPQNHVNGISLARLLSDRTEPPVRPFFWHNSDPRPTITGDEFSSAVRIGDLKLVEFPTRKRIELYDLSKDPEEAENLAEARPMDVERLMSALGEWKESVGVSD